MAKTESEIYEEFISYMNNPVWEFTESEHKMPMITSFITPAEAAFLTGFPLAEQPIEDIAASKEMSPEELLPKIKALCEKGLIYQSIEEGSIRYRLNLAAEMFLRMPYWPGKDEEPLKSMAPHANKYYMDGWYDQIKVFPHPGLRAIPIQETVHGDKTVLPFEDIVKVVDAYEFHSVSHCPCRVRHGLDPDFMESPFPTEVCLHFNELGKYIVNNGLGREITREETVEILKKAADAGLVHGISNTEENPETICNCDLEYCTFFKPFHQMGHDKSMDASNYRAVVSPETCTACSQCIRRCPMDAIQLKFSPKVDNKFRKAAQVDTELCIGCGVCAYKCKAKAITLERTDQTTRPPKTRMDLVAQNVQAALASKGNL